MPWYEFISLLASKAVIPRGGPQFAGMLGEWPGARCSSSSLWLCLATSSGASPSSSGNPGVGCALWQAQELVLKLLPTILGKLGRFAMCPQFLLQKEYAPGITSLRNATLNGVLTRVVKVLLRCLSVRIMLFCYIVILQPPPTFVW